MGMKATDTTAEQRRWPGMPEHITNMDWEELLDLIQEIRENIHHAIEKGSDEDCVNELVKMLNV